MMMTQAPQRPTTYAEQALVQRILAGVYPPTSALPAERVLASELGITRPTLREALQRMHRDGWVIIRQGKATIVNDIWRDGGLNVLGTLVRHADELPAAIVPQLLEVRLALAPAYIRSAVERNPQAVLDVLAQQPDAEADAVAFADFDWHLHHTLTIASGNPIFTLILNGFSEFYTMMARRYFALPETRSGSKAFYVELAKAAAARDGERAAAMGIKVMTASIMLWEIVARAEEIQK